MVMVLAENALDAFRAALGEDFVVVDPAKREEYQSATYLTRNRIPAIIFPGSVEEVQECLKIANRFKVPVYPISTGKNYGYGSRVPTADQCVVMELSRMNRIVDFNEELGYVVLEPGVTQGQLNDFLKARNSKLWMDATGATVGHSIIGNMVERGFGHTPYGDHFGNVGGMEVVLPNGDCIHTGLGQFPNAKAKGVYRWGLGPYVDGLFTQSNLGVVTQATIWLMPAPEHHEYFFFSFDHRDQLAEVIDLLRPLRLNGTLDSAIHVTNDYKVVTSIQAYPWDKTGGNTPLPKSVLDETAKTWDFGAWNGYSALYGTKQEVASAKKAIKRQLQGKVKKLQFLSEGLLNLAERFQGILYKLTGKNIPEMMKVLKPVYFLTKGVPTETFMASTYWRKKGKLPEKYDPDRDGCGLLWCSPIAPLEGRHVAAIWGIAEPLFLRYGFEPTIAITLLTERTVDCVMTICFDRSVAGEDERALECHDEMLRQLAEAGYYPYRLSTQAMDKLPSAQEPYLRFLRTMKAALDENGILAPGRYIR
jgi:4-cresol dehydrogenase (hydroxylating)